jgi:drug/metabolite transporter (DMT)-like permease
MRGAAWMVGSALTFVIATSLIKYIGPGYPAPLQAFYRNVAGFVVLIPWMIKGWPKVFHTTRMGIMLFRSSLGVVAMILNFYAYQLLPLADANALSFTRTLWMVPLVFFFLREKLGPARIGAAVVGFAGVLIILQPWSHGVGSHAIGFGLPQMAALASALLFALTITGMKMLTRDHSPTTLLIYAAALGLVFSIPPALFVWRWADLHTLGLLAAMGVVGTISQGCYIKGMQLGDASAMTPIDYTRLIFATGIGIFVFHEVPTTATIIGSAIVVGSTLFITFRERALAKRRLPVVIAP